MKRWWRCAATWAANQSRRSWWVLPLQPIFAVTVLVAGVAAVWPTDFSDFHDQLGPVAAHAWLTLGVVAPSMTLVSYGLILRCSGLWRYAGFWLRAGGDIGQAIVLAVFTMMHVTYTNSDEDIYVTVCFSGALLALLVMIVRDVWEIVLTERLAGRIHRGNGG